MRGLYIHIPFCKSKCPYCGFYSECSFDDETIERYLNACLCDLKTKDDKNFDTIYIGGGTPSAIKPSLMAGFISKVLSEIAYKNAEFTIEANPESVSQDFVAILKDFPVSRVSLGVQSFNDDVLKLLGRAHSAKKAVSAAEKLMNSEINLNIDMIYDIPNVSRDIIFETAEKIISINPTHVSAYSYSSEDRGYLKGFDSDNSLYEEIELFFDKNEIHKYEVSNFAKNGFESKHNILYWQMDEYVGIGASSHSMKYLQNGSYVRISKPNDTKRYINGFINNEEYDTLEASEGLKEGILLGLRMKRGADVAELERRFCKMPEILSENIMKYERLGFLEWNSGILKTTQKGSLLLERLSYLLWSSF